MVEIEDRAKFMINISTVPAFVTIQKKQQAKTEAAPAFKGYGAADQQLSPRDKKQLQILKDPYNQDLAKLLKALYQAKDTYREGPVNPPACVTVSPQGNLSKGSIKNNLVALLDMVSPGTHLDERRIDALADGSPASRQKVGILLGGIIKMYQNRQLNSPYVLEQITQQQIQPSSYEPKNPNATRFYDLSQSAPPSADAFWETSTQTSQRQSYQTPAPQNDFELGFSDDDYNLNVGHQTRQPALPPTDDYGYDEPQRDYNTGYDDDYDVDLDRSQDKSPPSSMDAVKNWAIRLACLAAIAGGGWFSAVQVAEMMDKGAPTAPPAPVPTNVQPSPATTAPPLANPAVPSTAPTAPTAPVDPNLQPPAPTAPVNPNLQPTAPAPTNPNLPTTTPASPTVPPLVNPNLPQAPQPQQGNPLNTVPVPQPQQQPQG